MADAPALSTNSADYQTFIENPDPFDGFEFTARQDVAATALGLYVGTPISTGEFSVFLWNLSGDLIASATVGPGDTMNGAFAFVPITPVMLSRGDSYIVVAMTDGAAVTTGATVPSDSLISVIEDRYGFSSAFPTLTDGPDTYREGGNLLLAASFTAVLAADTGASATDHITSVAVLTGLAEADSVVTIHDGQTLLGTAVADATGVWSFRPALSDGAVTLTASGNDMAGDPSSATISFMLDATAPRVTETLVNDSGASSTDDITNDGALCGSGDPNAVVTLTEGGVVLGTTRANMAGVWSLSPMSGGFPLAHGAHTITATEADAAGNTGSATLSYTLATSSPSVFVELPDDTGIGIDQPGQSGVTSDPGLFGQVSGEDGIPIAGDDVTLTANGAFLATLPLSSIDGSWTYLPNLPDGTYTIVASAKDEAGNTGSETITFTLDTSQDGQTQMPPITEGLVNDTGAFAFDKVTSDPTLAGYIYGNYADPFTPNTSVTLTEGDKVVGIATAPTNGPWRYTPFLPDGVHTIVATETLFDGTIRSTTFTFTLDTTAPHVTERLVQDTGSSATDGITSDAALSGGGMANARVALTEGTIALGTVTADATGAWSFTPVLADSTNTITATETDLAGNVGSATTTFTLDTALPGLTSPSLTVDGNGAATAIGIAAPIDASVATSDLTIVAAALPDDGTITLPDGTLVTAGETLSSTELAGLSFTPTPGLFDQSATFTYEVTDPAGNSGTGTATLSIAAAPAPAPPTLTTSPEVTDDATPTLAGDAAPGSTVTLLDAGAAVGVAMADATTGAFAITPDAPLPSGVASLAVTATTQGGTSAPSAALAFSIVPPPVAGIVTTDLSSADVGAALGQGASLTFVGGTEAVKLTDGTLNLGPDTDAATLQRLYEGLLGRSSDPGGISFYDGMLQAGVSKATVADSVASSPEYLAEHGSQTDQQFVATLYQGLLGRPASADPLSGAFLGLLAQGVSRGSVAVSVADSPEAKSYLAAATTQVFVADPAGTLAHELYETGLGREVELPALANWQAAFASMTQSQFAGAIAGSAEFALDHGGQSNAAYVDALSEAGLGRAIGPVGSAFWTGLLNSGTSRGDVLLGIATSSEAAAHLTHTLTA